MNKKIKKNDFVQVITGSCKGQRGVILKIIPEKNLAMVQGIKLQTVHRKQTPSKAGGKTSKEGFINISNLSLCDSDGSHGRVGYKIVEGIKTRFIKKSGKNI